MRCKLFRCCAIKGAPPMSVGAGSNGGSERRSGRAATVVNNPVFNNPKLRKIIGPSSPARSRRSRSRSRRRKNNSSLTRDNINHSPPSSTSSSPSSSTSLDLTRGRSGDASPESISLRQLSFNTLPEEVQLHVFSFLSPVDVLSVVPATCRHWRDLTQDETLWKVLQEEHFGGARRSDRSWHQECILALTRIKRQTQRYQTEMLLWGAKHGHSQFVRRMLREFNIDVNVRSHKSEASPLHLAAAQGNYDTIELLLSCGADVNAKTSYGRTPLERAARYGHASVVQLLLFRGANVNTTTEGGETPLLMAAGNNHKKVVKILLDHDADVTAASAGFTAMRIATLQGYTEIVQLLQSHANTQPVSSSSSSSSASSSSLLVPS
jgi:hypothetical protein